MGLETKKVIINGKVYDLSGNGSSNINIIDNTETEDSNSALSAKQGKILNDKVEEIKGKTVVAEYDEKTRTIDLQFNTPVQGIIEDNLTSNNSYNALSAKQGKILDEKIADISNKISAKYIASDTGVGITYDDNWVNISFVITSYVTDGSDNTTIATLPKNVQLKQPIYATEILLNSNWYPTNDTVYVSFTSNTIRIRTSKALNNAVLLFNRTYPRSLFTIT